MPPWNFLRTAAHVIFTPAQLARHVWRTDRIEPVSARRFRRLVLAFVGTNPAGHDHAAARVVQSERLHSLDDRVARRRTSDLVQPIEQK